MSGHEPAFRHWDTSSRGVTLRRSGVPGQALPNRNPGTVRGESDVGDQASAPRYEVTVHNDGENKHTRNERIRGTDGVRRKWDRGTILPPWSSEATGRGCMHYGRRAVY